MWERNGWVAKGKRKVNAEKTSRISYLLMSDSAYLHTSPKSAKTFFKDYSYSDLRLE